MALEKKIRIEDEDALDRFRNKKCVVCGRPSDPAHIRSVGVGGDDVDSNLVSFCRYHHSLQHTWGWEKFLRKFPIARYELEKKGFEIVDCFGVKKLRKI